MRDIIDVNPPMMWGPLRAVRDTKWMSRSVGTVSGIHSWGIMVLITINCVMMETVMVIMINWWLMVDDADDFFLSLSWAESAIAHCCGGERVPSAPPVLSGSVPLLQAGLLLLLPPQQTQWVFLQSAPLSLFLPGSHPHCVHCINAALLTASLLACLLACPLGGATGHVSLSVQCSAY